jgi:hypothetical protein
MRAPGAIMVSDTPMIIPRLFFTQTYSPSSASPTLPLAAPAQAASRSEIPAATDCRPGLELPSPHYDARTIVLEARAELEGSAITKSQSARPNNRISRAGRLVTS